MLPDNWFLPRPRSCRLVRLPNSAGMLPDNWLEERSSDCRFVRLPNSAGMLPDNWLDKSHRSCRPVRSPSWDGMVPIKLFSWRYNLVTRPPSSVLTSCHSSSGLSLSQLVLFVQFGPSVALYSASSAARSSLTEPLPTLLTVTCTLSEQLLFGLLSSLTLSTQAP